ncbi:hypothetical protein HK102_001947, partial [Quaeritorhiza haematococci]
MLDTATKSYDKILQDIADYVVQCPTTHQFSPESFHTARLVLADSMGCAMLSRSFPECTRLLGPMLPDLHNEQPRSSGFTGAKVPGTTFSSDPVKTAFDLTTMIRYLDFNDTWLALEWGHPSDNLGALLAVGDYLSRLHHYRSTSQPLQKFPRNGDNLFATRFQQGAPLTMRDILEAMVKAHEIQGVLSLGNSLNRVGLDHVLFVKVASVAVVTGLLGGGRQEIMDAVSQAWIDNSPLRVYRHSPNTGSRKSWASGDAASRAVHLALMTLKTSRHALPSSVTSDANKILKSDQNAASHEDKGEPSNHGRPSREMGYPSCLTTPRWGFQDVVLRGNPLVLTRPLGCYVMENVLFKVQYPAEFHAQTAVEAAVRLHGRLVARQRKLDGRDRSANSSGTGDVYNAASSDGHQAKGIQLADSITTSQVLDTKTLASITRIVIHTHEPAIRIISKPFPTPLTNAADRDHCLQYMIAVALLTGLLTSEDYRGLRAADERLEQLRQKMEVVEDEEFTRWYYDEERRAIANRVIICVKRVEAAGGKAGNEDRGEEEPEEMLGELVEHPIGHRTRRREAEPLIWGKFQRNLECGVGRSVIEDQYVMGEGMWPLSREAVERISE